SSLRTGADARGEVAPVGATWRIAVSSTASHDAGRHELPVRTVSHRRARARQPDRHRADVPVLGERWLRGRLAHDPPRPSRALGRRPADRRGDRGLARTAAARLIVEAPALSPEGRITASDIGLYSDANEAALAHVLAAMRANSP